MAMVYSSQECSAIYTANLYIDTSKLPDIKGGTFFQNKICQFQLCSTSPRLESCILSEGVSLPPPVWKTFSKHHLEDGRQVLVCSLLLGEDG